MRTFPEEIEQNLKWAENAIGNARRRNANPHIDDGTATLAQSLQTAKHYIEEAQQFALQMR